MELEESMFLTSDDATNYSHQDSIVLAQRQKYRSIESPKIYNGEKTISLTSCAGKTGQPLVKEWN